MLCLQILCVLEFYVLIIPISEMHIQINVRDLYILDLKDSPRLVTSFRNM